MEELEQMIATAQRERDRYKKLHDSKEEQYRLVSNELETLRNLYQWWESALQKLMGTSNAVQAEKDGKVPLNPHPDY